MRWIWKTYRSSDQQYLGIKGVNFISRLFSNRGGYDFKKQPPRVQQRIIEWLNTNPSGKTVASYFKVLLDDEKKFSEDQFKQKTVVGQQFITEVIC